MKSPFVRSHIRKKAVWGLKSALSAFIALMLTLSGATAFAKGPHHRHYGHAGRPGRPNKFVKK